MLLSKSEPRALSVGPGDQAFKRATPSALPNGSPQRAARQTADPNMHREVCLGRLCTVAALDFTRVKLHKCGSSEKRLDAACSLPQRLLAPRVVRGVDRLSARTSAMSCSPSKFWTWRSARNTSEIRGWGRESFLKLSGREVVFRVQVVLDVRATSGIKGWGRDPLKIPPTEKLCSMPFLTCGPSCARYLRGAGLAPDACRAALA